MSVRLTIAITLVLLVVLASSPWMWQWNPWSLAVVGPVLIAWYIYLVYAYLRWARRLGGRKTELND